MRPGGLQLDELRALRVVDLDGAVKSAGEAGGDDAEPLELAALRAAGEAGRDQQRLAFGGHAGALELGRSGGQRVLTRVVERPG